MHPLTRIRGDSNAPEGTSRDIERSKRLRQCIEEKSAQGTPDSDLAGHIKELIRLEKAIRK